MFFDTHAHYDDDAFDSDRDELLAALPEKCVSLVVNPGCSYDSSLAAVRLAEKYPHVYAAVGWHPQDADKWDVQSEVALREWAKHEKVLAIGEIGLDYHYDDGPSKEIQISVFRKQLELAKELDLPVIIHDRDAHADCLELVQEAKGTRGVFHCYSGSAEMAREILKLGWYLSFTGVITFKNAKKALEVIRITPMDRIMLETDSPYLAPVPNRGKRNDSSNLPYIAQTIADIKGISVQEVARITRENGMRFFGLS